MAVRKLFPPKVICGAEINAIVDKQELYGNGSMFAHVRLETGAVVDWHVHNGEVEYYYILKGVGVYTDEDGTEYTVSAGDVCTITPDHGHAIRNQEAETLEFIALVVYSH
jgi:quercetin dioxygenase-like cupin family protein